MQITFIQGILVAVVVFICAFDKHMESFMWFRPLVVAFLTGIVLGNVQLGLAAGAVTELSYLGLLTVGGTVPPDPLFAAAAAAWVNGKAGELAQQRMGSISMTAGDTVRCVAEVVHALEIHNS